jgi:hypothetical protein
MTTFKEIRGTDILALSSDPSNPEVGQIWYNSSSGTLKGYRTVNAWSSGGNMGTARYELTGGGTQAAAIGAGGYLPGLSPFAGARNTELYNGTSWSDGALMNQGKHEAGMFAGSQTAALIAGGYAGSSNLTASESWNGSAWTNTSGLNTARRGTFRGMGTQTAAVCIGGTITARTAAVESWNGSSWTTVTSIPTATSAGAASGTQTAGLIFGGYSTTQIGNSLTYNGSTWTAVNSLNTARSGLSGSNGPQGTQTAALAFGGSTGTVTGATESWGGSSWTTLPATLGTPRQVAGGAGSNTAALMFGGATAPGPRTAATEAFIGIAVQTITVS